MAANKRVDWIDFAKGIAMFFVIVTHANIDPLKSGTIPFYCYFFMPLFFLLSGYLTKPLNVESKSIRGGV